MRPLSLLLLVFSVAVGVRAQHAPPSDITPLLLPGLGHPNHPIATKNAEAQKYFDQGLQLVFGFNRAEAVRSFRRASQLDPQAAMPYWGEAPGPRPPHEYGPGHGRLAVRSLRGHSTGSQAQFHRATK
jgi:hypothetical protein